jgi:hypothetical protein
MEGRRINTTGTEVGKASARALATLIERLFRERAGPWADGAYLKLRKPGVGSTGFAATITTSWKLFAT